jgi:hypothetical protein
MGKRLKLSRNFRVNSYGSNVTKYVFVQKLPEVLTKRIDETMYVPRAQLRGHCELSEALP